MNDDFSCMLLEYQDEITIPVELVKQKLVLARKSFGPHWCMDGYCWLTFDYIRQETMDNWVFDVALDI
jgi:C1A family cysteine protease